MTAVKICDSFTYILPENSTENEYTSMSFSSKCRGYWTQRIQLCHVIQKKKKIQKVTTATFEANHRN